MYPYWKRLSHDIVKLYLMEWRVTVIILSVCLFVYPQNSSKPANIGTLKTLPAGVNSYNNQK